MRKLTIAVLTITAVTLLALGPAPRYLEELRIGGGFGDPTDGGADFARDGAIDTDGPLQTRADLAVGAFDSGVDHALTLRVPDARTAALYLYEADSAHGGAVWFDGALNRLRFGTRNGAGLVPAIDIARGSADVTLQGRLSTASRISAADGLALGASALGVGGALGIKAPLYTGANTGLRIAHNASGSTDNGLVIQSNGADVLRVTNSGAATVVGDLSVAGGDIDAGQAGVVRGTCALPHGPNGNQPGYLKLTSRAGTAWHLFVEDDGTLRICNVVPANNTDGMVVGLQF
jgi:hypothetical protein